MMRRAHNHGLALPDGWQTHFHEDTAAPMMGSRSGGGRLFVLRRRRTVGRSDGETIHRSVRERIERLPGYHPRGLMHAPESPDP